ncbi:hypothetical protein CW702_02610 [Candidatus Bathyarchaeota archaeon]|nr:MAG: hypothetical protein CW702_02610 [Candidatus Bathyarchaeota archaeon]
MNSDIEVIPVTQEEIIRILGALRIEDLEDLLDEIKFLRRISSSGGDYSPHRKKILETVYVQRLQL